MPPEKKKVPAEKMLDFFELVRDKFNRFVSINEEDPIVLVVVKVMLRAVGVIILLILSPFIILALVISILLVL